MISENTTGILYNFKITRKSGCLPKKIIFEQIKITITLPGHQLSQYDSFSTNARFLWFQVPGM